MLAAARAAVALVAACMAALGVSVPAIVSPAAAGATSPAIPGTNSATGAITDAAPCHTDRSLTCATLRVPLDPSGQVPGTLHLRILYSNNSHAPGGTLLLLAGGPGQPGVGFAQSVHNAMPEVAAGYRIVGIDQRGTGPNAIKCPAVQKQIGSSDVLAATPTAVQRCSATVGADRGFYSTADTVADLETLRTALGVDRWSMEGVSYGTYVEEHYALTYPDHVDRLVLDSVVPSTGMDPFMGDVMTTSRPVLASVCREAHCHTDPASQLARLVRRRDAQPGADGRPGVALLNTLIGLSIGPPPTVYRQLRAFIEDVASAVAGRPKALNALIAKVREAGASPYAAFSAGLHTATLCTDFPMPWGNSATPLAGRAASLARTAGQLTPAQVLPFDTATVTHNGLIQNCLPWAPTSPGASPASNTLPAVPTLILAGGRDLATPLAGARAELALAPAGTLHVVPRSGHDVESSVAGKRAAVAFLCADQRCPAGRPATR